MSKIEITTPLTYQALQKKSRDWLIDVIMLTAKEIERLKARELEIAEKAYREGWNNKRVGIPEWINNAADAEWLNSDIHKELTND